MKKTKSLISALFGTTFAFSMLLSGIVFAMPQQTEEVQASTLSELYTECPTCHTQVGEDFYLDGNGDCHVWYCAHCVKFFDDDEEACVDDDEDGYCDICDCEMSSSETYTIHFDLNISSFDGLNEDDIEFDGKDIEDLYEDSEIDFSYPISFGEWSFEWWYFEATCENGASIYLDNEYIEKADANNIITLYANWEYDGVEDPEEECDHASLDWQVNDYEHWKECDICGEIDLESGEHYDGDEDGCCDVCDYPMGDGEENCEHTGNVYYVSDDHGNHSIYCEDCDECIGNSDCTIVNGKCEYDCGYYVTYTINYNLNEGSGTTPSSTTATVEDAFNLASGTGLTRTGYTFAGWSTNSQATTGETDSYQLEPEDLPASGTTITLYAVWTEDTSGGGSQEEGGGTGENEQDSGDTPSTPSAGIYDDTLLDCVSGLIVILSLAVIITIFYTRKRSE